MSPSHRREPCLTRNDLAARATWSELRLRLGELKLVTSALQVDSQTTARPWSDTRRSSGSTGSPTQVRIDEIYTVLAGFLLTRLARVTGAWNVAQLTMYCKSPGGERARLARRHILIFDGRGVLSGHGPATAAPRGLADRRRRQPSARARDHQHAHVRQRWPARAAHGTKR